MRRPIRKAWALHTSEGGKTVKCNICEREFANSVELKAHMERDHALDERGDEELEKPDMMPEETQTEPTPIVPGKN
ncbi:MAG TPA: C2H2-type zinc finger protein [Candidatus Dormibacteraeota bacterium]